MAMSVKTVRNLVPVYILIDFCFLVVVRGGGGSLSLKTKCDPAVGSHLYLLASDSFLDLLCLAHKFYHSDSRSKGSVSRRQWNKLLGFWFLHGPWCVDHIAHLIKTLIDLIQVSLLSRDWKIKCSFTIGKQTLNVMPSRGFGFWVRISVLVGMRSRFW